MSGWEGYIYQLQNRFNTETNEYTLTNVCEFGAIYGLDGTKWAASQGFELYNYEFDMELEDGSTKKVPINEFTCALEATKGNRKGSEAGIRIANQKYMFLRQDPTIKSVYLGRQGGGGACVVQTAQALVIGVWNKSA
mmetsp:Transcript_6473/g.5556  ORF Transcript_6473/g.5556 Transcript_6473/m.5556 type:complete len:137 (-) Transcript_6473:102-512(-)